MIWFPREKCDALSPVELNISFKVTANESTRFLMTSGVSTIISSVDQMRLRSNCLMEVL